MAKKLRVKGGKVKNLSALRSSLKKGGGSGYLTRIPADGSLTVRFLTEPDEWVEYHEHYDDVRKFYPCSDDCPGCLEGESPSKRYLANALDVTEGKVVPLVLPKSLASSILKKYDKYATLMDRDYELDRSGTGFETEYDATPEPPTKMNVSRYDLIDLMDVLEGQLDSSSDDDDDDDDDDEDEAPAKGKKVPPKKAIKKNASAGSSKKAPPKKLLRKKK